jgi:hypothetical protein
VTAIGLGLTDTGWLWTEPADALLKVNIQIVASEQCAADLAVLCPNDTLYEDVMLCAGVEEGDKGACDGDSGGPLLELRDGEYVQVGISSWVMVDECVAPNAPVGFTRVSAVKDWIDQMICELSGNPPANCNSTQCEDVPGWYDSVGPEYDCAWYAEHDTCQHASGYENNGFSATEACCVCGGGNGGNDDDGPPTPPPREDIDSAGNCYGVFSGELNQTNPDALYNVTISYTSAGIVTTYSFSDRAPCGNTVPIVPNVVLKGRLEWIEIIEYGNNCVNNGNVSLTEREEGDIWDFFWSKQDDQSTVSGPLTIECSVV